MLKTLSDTECVDNSSPQSPQHVVVSFFRTTFRRGGVTPITLETGRTSRGPYISAPGGEPEPLLLAIAELSDDQLHARTARALAERNGAFYGSFVTFCDTFRGFVLKLLLKLSRFYRGKEAVFCVKRAQSESNYLFYSPCFDVSQPPRNGPESAGGVTDPAHPTFSSRSSL